MGIPESTADQLSTILDNVRDFLKGQRNVAVDRLALLNRCQHEGESFEDFLTRINVMADDADIENMTKKDWMATLLTIGVTSDEARQEVLVQTKAPSYDETLIILRAKFKGARGCGDLRGRSTSVAGVAAARKRSKTPYKKGKWNKSGVTSQAGAPSSQSLSQQKCPNCGYKAHSVANA